MRRQSENGFSMIGVMDRPSRKRPLNELGAEYAQAITTSKQRRVKLNDAKKKKAAESLRLASDELAVANALANWSFSYDENELIQIATLNKQMLDEAQTQQADYEVDIREPERQARMLNFEIRKLTEFAYALYGETGLRKIERYYPRAGGRAASIRAFFENFDGDQCKGALQGRNPFLPGRSPCWICGFTIPGGSQEGYTMECEHVYPIAQAVFFIDLYRGKATSRDTIELVQAEYDWSHRVCNQIKNNKHFVRVRGEGGNKTWVVAPVEEFDTFLRQIYNGSDAYFPGVHANRLRTDIGPNVDQWVASRIPIIMARVQRVLDVGVQQCIPGIFTIIRVARCLDMYIDNIGMVEDRLAKKALAKNTDKSGPKQRPGGTRRKKRGASRKNGSVVTRSMARRTRRNAK